MVDPGSWRFRFVRWLARLMLKSQYRVIEVEGAERVPKEGAVLLLANHFSSLVDSMALLDASPRPAAFLAKAPLWKIPPLRFFLEATGALPVYRQQDVAENEGRTVRANMKTVEVCRERLAAGGSLALFPEGVSQPRPRLMPLRTGAARMALDAKAEVSICPVGLVYERGRFGRRGKLLVRFGEPWSVNGIEGFPSRRAAITATTRSIESSLKGLLAEAPSQSDLETMQVLRVVWDQEEGRPPPRSFAEEHRRIRDFASALAELRSVAPKLLDEVRASADDYMRALALAGIPAENVPTRYSAGRVLKYVLKNLPFAIIGIPVGLLAAIVTWPIRKAGDVVAMRELGGTEDMRTLCRMLGVGALLVVIMVALGLFAWFKWGLGWGLAVLIGLPVLLAVHVWWRDRGMELLIEVRCFLLLAGGNLRGELLRYRKALYGLLVRAQERLARASKDAAA